MKNNVIDLFQDKEVWIIPDTGKHSGRQLINYATAREGYTNNDVLRTVVRLPHPDPLQYVFLLGVNKTGKYYLCSMNLGDLGGMWAEKGIADAEANGYAAHLAIMLFRSRILEDSTRVTASDTPGSVAVATTTMNMNDLIGQQELYIAHCMIGQHRVKLPAYECMGVTQSMLEDINGHEFAGLFTLGTSGEKVVEHIKALEGYWAEPLTTGLLQVTEQAIG